MAASVWGVFNEFIYVFHPITTKIGGLTHLIFIERKHEPLGN